MYWSQHPTLTHGSRKSHRHYDDHTLINGINLPTKLCVEVVKKVSWLDPNGEGVCFSPIHLCQAAISQSGGKSCASEVNGFTNGQRNFWEVEQGNLVIPGAKETAKLLNFALNVIMNCNYNRGSDSHSCAKWRWWFHWALKYVPYFWLGPMLRISLTLRVSLICCMLNCTKRTHVHSETHMKRGWRRLKSFQPGTFL